MKRETVIAQRELFAADRSKLQKYCDLIVGKHGLWNVCKFEFISAFTGMPGALGLALRARLYPRLLKSCGRNVVFGRNVTLRHPHKIEIGNDVVIDENCMLDAKGTDNEGIRIGNGVFIGRNTILSCKNGDIVLGDKANIGFNCEVVSASNVTLGANTLVAAYSYFIGGDHDASQVDMSVSEQGRCSLGIVVGEGAWFGAGAKILDGVRVGANSIIGAGAVVTEDIPEYVVAVGIPAKVIKQRLAEKQPVMPPDDKS